MPAGYYIYSASLYVTPVGGPSAVSCIVVGADTSASSGLGETIVSTPQRIPIIGRLQLSSPSGAVIRCSKGIGGPANNFKVHGGLTVVRVQTVHPNQ